jgi:hypothetical protein
MKAITFALLLSLWALPAQAQKKFASQYCEFMLPAGWECVLEGTEWVCQSVNQDRRKEAIIILAAKVRGAQDSLAEYEAYLKKPKTFTLPGGKTQVSEAKKTEVIALDGGQRWVDSLHMASEVPGFYTRYLATVKEDLGVAVTFSVAKDHYERYQKVFDSVVKTLRVFRQKQNTTDYIAKGGKELVEGEGGWIPDVNDPNDIRVRQKGQESGSGGENDLLIYGGLAAVAAIFVLKKLKGGAKKKSSKKKKS